MDSNRFDRLAKSFATLSTRRRLVGFLAFLPPLTSVVEFREQTEASRHHRRKSHHKHDLHRAHSEAKKKKKKDKKKRERCVPEPASQTCARGCGKQTNNCNVQVNCGDCGCVPDVVTQTCLGKCGQVINNCNAPVDCGRCTCNPICTDCQICTSASTCVTDPTMAGRSCGNCHVCISGQCVPCPQCCDVSGNCQEGSTNTACGAIGQTCDICTGQEQCQNRQCTCVPLASCPNGKNCGDIPDGCGSTIHCGDCVAPETCEGGGVPNVCGCPGSCVATCSSHSECPPDHICAEGNCHECDAVCPTGRCTAPIPQAIARVAPRTTIYVCPGRYGSVNPNRDITIIGAGPEATILDSNGNAPVVNIGSDHTTDLRELRITGAAGNTENGLPGGVVNDGSLTMTNCLVTGNTAASGGGGIRNNSELTMTDCTVSRNDTVDGVFGGGGIFQVGTSLTLRNCTIEENTTGAQGGGLLVYSGDATLDEDCRVQHNSASNGGGGVYRNSGTVTIEGSSPAEVVSENCPENCGNPSTVDSCSGAGSTCP